MPRFNREKSNEPLESNKWLKKLQQESWELELLVSGFSILLLAKGIDWLTNIKAFFEASLNFQIEISNIIIVFLAIVLLAVHALVLNLIIHLIFRGFWVGVVGLGSVAPNADFDKLKYSKFFTEKLKIKVTSLDELVIRVDRISSVLFAFAFLIIFLLISIALFFGGLVTFATVGSNLIENISGWIAEVLAFILNTLSFTFLIVGVIYLIDFLTFGAVKKIKFISRIYYPFYKFFGWITLAFIYRTIYYNLISRFTKKRTALILIPYLLILVTLPGIKMDHHIYYPDRFNEHTFPANYYEDVRDDDNVRRVSIPSFVMDGSYIPLFIKYDPNDNSVIRALCPDYEPAKNEGLNTGIRINNVDGQINISHTTRIREPEPKKSLDCLSQLYEIHINDSLIDIEEMYFHSINKRRGIVTMLTIDSLPKGRNHIIVYKKEMKNDSTFESTIYASIPFWKEN